ncbi:peptidoglycan/LPS O-acetylase OafA/YrhL [Sediminihabitans luteus]|uniref:Peptidoglycan/LPS O-acetylase OafA/YrhL n=1 Tax=Sediminihabitans luteus TaxID=1138585 RepID=A0A2M9CDS3_9CELL|nr:acyltransferase family protein [Sediminihabitans luteus]PJJ70000.1 peptidoglycan/LPS O-acetylase OafA/YrhL [Sediminihabitans luteus]GII99321.1 acyltransferase [Sediminihabitans luteus]
MTTTIVPPARHAKVPVEGTVRHDVQALRAIAVTAVLLYHLWPARLTGGYVGVDVFFVISGFLITSHLLRRPVASFAGLASFWARRVRRLVPAATLVLLVTLAASLVLLPSTVRPTLATEVGASALSLENWVLAASATDYLAAGDLHTPVQHFWSLSVEEQFYLLWPLLVGGLVAAGVRVRRGWLPAAGVGLVVAASLTWSVHLTATDPAAAYFVSTTRFWELGLGALLATLVARASTPLPRPARLLAVWGGLALIGWSVVVFDAATPFPSWTALVPTLGTALVIAAASDGLRGGPSRVWAWRPVGWLGGISYSLYLWHWPLIVLAPFALGHVLVWPEKLAIVALALALAALTKSFVEDPVRRSALLHRRLRSTFVLLALSVALVVGAAAATAAVARAQESAADEAVAAARAESARCFGTSAVHEPGCEPEGTELVTTPAFAKADRPELYADRCWANVRGDARPVCHYGAPDATTKVALLGNSHAGHWQPVIADYLAPADANLTTRLISECYTVDVPIAFAVQAERDRCSAWNAWAIEQTVAGGYDLVVMSDRTFRPLEGVAPGDKADVARASYARVLDEITSSGTPVLVLRDTPAQATEIPDCVAENSAPEEWDACATPASRAIEDDPLAAAGLADTSGLVTVLDVNSLLCVDGSCPPVLGGVIAYFDHGHMTTTLARTLAPEVFAALDEALGREQPTPVGAP